MEDLSNLPISLDNLPIDLNFSVWAIVAGLLFSSIGLWLFRHGKRNENRRNIYSGVVLMIYPYFIASALMNWVIGLVICGYVFYWWD
ncbi:hypothetical protein [Bdellovibrio svalbardensis]|uniref:Uncharacterized protein n=1 Tax=Bdellovibrio svalbardensis TaxID=2972972 RepID=A0ABT6DEN1_9BACT|nr:hypothetical protein [Bdellovibrio svalbardensis]MDG0815277.1 hypothetical protein [Bdellovibrio svalbardensis]